MQKNIEERFKNNNKVTVYNYGLSKDDSIEYLYIDADSSSTFKSSSKGVEIHLKKLMILLQRTTLIQSI